jgi:LemA protein
MLIEVIGTIKNKGEKLMLYIIAFGVLIVILVLWIISVQRSFVALDENINNAMSQIGVQISSRWDALTSLLDLTKGYAAHEYNTITDTIKARRSITKDSSPDDIKKQENIIAEAMGKIMAVAESYPDLKADATYIKTMDGVNQYENMVRTSRLIYNDSVTKLNRAIRMFPAVMIAGVLGFSKRIYLEAVDEKANMPSMK